MMDERVNPHLLGPLLGSVLIHLCLLIAVSSGRIGSGSGMGLSAKAATPLEVSFSVNPVARANPVVQISQHACADCAGPSPEEPPQAKLTADAPAALPYYWPLGLVDKPPRPLNEIDLNTPELDAFAANGKVELIALVGAEGRVEDIRVTRVESETGSEILQFLLTERFRDARFAPGEVNGRPVATAVPITVVIESR